MRELTETERSVAAAALGKIWQAKRPEYEAMVLTYRWFGQFDNANGLSEVMHQFDNGNFVTGREYRGLP